MRGETARTRISRAFILLTIGNKWAVGTVIGYGITRLLAVAAYFTAAQNLPESVTKLEGHISGWELMTRAWDSGWYTTIIEDGYPATLPTDNAGQVTENPWAFYPLFPMLARLLSVVTGLPAGTAGAIVSLMMGLAAVILLRKLLITVWPGSVEAVPWVVFTAPLALAAYPASGVFSAAYSDSTGIAVVIATLLLLTSKRYVWLCIAILILGLARPIAPPIGVVVIVHFWPQIVGSWRRTQVVPWRPLAWLVAIGASCLVSVALWPLIAAISTGQPTALFDTQASWPRPEGGDPSIPLSVWNVTLGGAALGLLAFAAIIGIFAVLFRSLPLRPFGRELYTWSLAYIVFIFSTVAVSTSTLRLLIPALSLHLFIAVQVSSWRQSLSTLTVLLLTQFLWITTWYTSFHLSP